MVSIAVQPPTHARVNTHLYPPLVARSKLPDDSTAQYFFAMAILVDPEGNVLDQQDRALGGTAVVTGAPLFDDGSTIFLFPDLYLPCPGGYFVRVDVYKVDLGDPEGARLVEQVYSRGMAAHDGPVGVEKPSSTERSMMRLLRDQGHVVPQPPSN